MKFLVLLAGVLALGAQAWVQASAEESAPAVSEDPVVRTLEEVLGHYRAGQTFEALDGLQTAAALIRRQRSAGLVEFLPQPPEGWSAQAVDTNGAAIPGGGIGVLRRYTDGAREVQVQIVSESPLLQSYIMMLSNPVVLSAQGGRLETVAGHQAMVREDGLTMVLFERYLVMITGAAAPEELLGFAAAIDFTGLEAFR